MITFEEYYYKTDLLEYNQAISLIEQECNGLTLTEEAFIKIPDSVREKYWFIINLAQISKTKVLDLLVACKKKKVFEFFREIKFSLGLLYGLMKTGFGYYTSIQNVIAEYVANTKVVKWTEDELKKLHDYLVKHPKLKKAGGLVVGGLLLFIWLNMSSTGDAKYDFDLSSVLDAVRGNYNVAELFAGSEGTKMLLLFATGMAGLTFPWPTPTNVNLVVALVNGIIKLSKG